MHRPDAEALHAFYRSPLGRVTQERLAGHIKQLWPQPGNDAIAGIGYALPYLEEYKTGAVIALLPGLIGPETWPEKGGNLTCLGQEYALPLREGTLNRALAVHGLEFSEKPLALLEEIWRVLVPKGRVLIVVPNRLGLWTRMERTPFGFGTPYSLTQLESLLKQTRFHVLRAGSALFMPPIESRFVLRTSALWRTLSRRCLKGMGGVLIVEAEKRLYAEVPEAVKERMAGLQPSAVTSLNCNVVTT